MLLAQWGGGHDFCILESNNVGTNLDIYDRYCSVGYTYKCRVGSYQDAACNIDFCGMNYDRRWAPDELEVWIVPPPPPYSS